MITLFSIGFTSTTAENFFNRLKQAGVRKVIDTRLWPDAQLSGFAKRKDLGFFLKNLAEADYEHNPVLAPSEDILRDYKDKKINWSEYERRYIDLLKFRRVAEILHPSDLDHSAFLCAECTADFCHRRLLVEYLQKSWPDSSIVIKHL
jgi:uncharacterized protein (DUF488 family)